MAALELKNTASASANTMTALASSTGSQINCIRPSGASKILAPNINEIQPTTQGAIGAKWCVGYVTAFISSYKTGIKFTAKNVATYLGISADDGILIKFAKWFAQDIGLTQTRYPLVQGIMSNGEIMNEIDDDCPVLATASQKSNVLNGHCFAIVGYKTQAAFNGNPEWTIWDPIFNKFMKIDKSREYTSPSGTAYGSWSQYLIEFKK